MTDTDTTATSVQRTDFVSIPVRDMARAKAFYGAILAATLAGVAMNFIRINPMQALLGSAVINGLVSVPLLVLMMLVAREPAIMGRLALPRRLMVLGWISTAIMLATSVGLVASLWL